MTAGRAGVLHTSAALGPAGGYVPLSVAEVAVATPWRIMAHSSSAIWLAVMPRVHISFKRSIRSSFHDKGVSFRLMACGSFRQLLATVL